MPLKVSKSPWCQCEIATMVTADTATDRNIVAPSGLRNWYWSLESLHICPNVIYDLNFF